MARNEAIEDASTAERDENRPISDLQELFKWYERIRLDGVYVRKPGFGFTVASARSAAIGT